jgi:hypothetical protein
MRCLGFVSSSCDVSSVCSRLHAYHQTAVVISRGVDDVEIFVKRMGLLVRSSDWVHFLSWADFVVGSWRKQGTRGQQRSRRREQSHRNNP